MLIAQLTDLHVTTPDRRSLGGADPIRRALAAARWLRALETPPDLGLLTGDNVQRGDAAEYAELLRVFADLPFRVLALPGNHDARDPLRAAAAPLGWVPADGDFLHQALTLDGLRVVLLDSLDPGNIGGRLCDARLDWLAEQLESRRGAPVLLALHHPPFDCGIEGLDAHGLQGRERLAELAAGHCGVVAALCGHLHRELACWWAGTCAISAPSSGRQFALSLAPGAEPDWSDDPPAAALHWWRPDRGLVSHVVNIPQD